METGLIHLINVNLKGQATYHDVYDVAMSGNGRVLLTSPSGDIDFTVPELMQGNRLWLESGRGQRFD